MRSQSLRARIIRTVSSNFLKSIEAFDASFAGLEVGFKVLRGAPERALAAYAKRRGDAMLVIQTHGKCGLDAFWDGSVAARIVSRLSCPVLLVPTDSTR